MTTYRIRVAAAAAFSGVLALLGSGVASADTPPGSGADYVNMGDSYSAGAGELPVALGTNLQCGQSTLSWGRDLAADHGYHLTDVSCSGAQTKDLSTPQLHITAPQLDALSSNTRLVTLTLGLNENNVSTNAFGGCSAFGLKSLGLGSPCRNIYGGHFVHLIESSTYHNLVVALTKIRDRAPNATVAISGYLQILPRTGGCFPVVPYAAGDIPYLNSIEDAVNDSAERAAEATGATFIDMSGVSAGHDACEPIGERWVEPTVGGVSYFPLHPNAAGERAMEDQAENALTLGPRRTAQTGVVRTLFSTIDS